MTRPQIETAETTVSSYVSPIANFDLCADTKPENEFEMKISAVSIKKKTATTNETKWKKPHTSDDNIQTFSPLLARCIARNTHTKESSAQKKNYVCFDKMCEEKKSNVRKQKTKTQKNRHTPNIAYFGEAKKEKKTLVQIKQTAHLYACTLALTENVLVWAQESARDCTWLDPRIISESDRIQMNFIRFAQC